MRRLLPTSKHASTQGAPILTREKSPNHKSSLWGQAYQDLAKENSKLVISLEELLNLELPAPQNQNSYAASGPSDREDRMSEFIRMRLAAMDDRKWRIKMGEHAIEVREQADRIVKLVIVAKDFISSVASMDPVHAGLPWAGICFMLPLLTNDSKQRSSAMDGLEYIARLVRRYTQIERLYLGDQLFRLTEDLRLAVVKLYQATLEFEARAACHFSRNTAHQTLRNMIVADGWDDILMNIKQYETNCEILLRIIDAEDRINRAEKLEGLITEQDRRITELLGHSRKQDEVFQQQILEELKQARNELRDRDFTEEESKCHACFRTNDYELDKEKNPDRVSGTCIWFLQHRKYQQWLKATESTWLWVTADPGCGKSVLSRFLVNNFNEIQSEALSMVHRNGLQKYSGSICYFFFKDDSEANRSAVNALASMLHQLLAQNRALIKHALSLYKQNGNRLAQLFESLWTIFTSAVADPVAGKIIIVLDALDECEGTSRTALVRKFTSFFSDDERKGFLKLLVTSRPSTLIGDQIWRGTIDPASIKLMGENEAELEAISVEIELVIREKIRQFNNQVKSFRSICSSSPFH